MKASVKDCWTVKSCETTSDEAVKYLHEIRACSHKVGVSIV